MSEWRCGPQCPFWFHWEADGNGPAMSYCTDENIWEKVFLGAVCVRPLSGWEERAAGYVRSLDFITPLIAARKAQEQPE